MTEFQMLLGLAGVLVAMMVLVFGTARLAVRRGSGKRKELTPSWDSVDVSGIAIAIDSRCRPFLEEAVDAHQSADVSAHEDRSNRLRELAFSLRRAEPAWRAAAIVNATPDHPTVAQYTFERETETLAKELGELSAVEQTGVSVLTIMVAARKELVDVEDTTIEGVRRVLAGLAALARLNVTALDIRWAPAPGKSFTHASVVALDQFSDLEADLEAYIYCESCGGPRGRAGGKCPHCQRKPTA